MNSQMLRAFSSELSSILEKRAEVIRDVGAPIAHTVAGAVPTRTVAQNLAGTAKAFMNPVSATRAGWAETVRSLTGKGLGPKVNTALLVGGTAAFLPGVFKKDDPSGQGMSRTARGVQFAGGQIGGLIGTPFGLSGGIAGGVAGDIAGKQVGKVVDKVRRYKKKPPALPTAPVGDPATAPTPTQPTAAP